MSEVSKSFAGSVGLLRAVEAAFNWRAFVQIAGSGFIGLILMALGAKLGWAGIIFAILALLVSLIGFSAAGIMLLDQAKGLEQRGIVNAFLAGIFTLPRMFGLLLLVILISLVFILALALLFFVCKIPGLGAFLYAFVFPAAALLTGVIYLAFIPILSLSSPMIWEGQGVLATLAHLWALVKQRLVMVCMNSILLVLLTLVVVGLVMAGVGVGTFVTLPLSASIIGQDTGFGGGGIAQTLMLAMQGGMGGEGMSGYLYAGFFGFAVIWFIAFTLPMLVYLKGTCLIYLAAIEGVEFEGAEAALSQRLAEVKKRAEAARERSMQAAAQRPMPSAPPAAQPHPIAALKCINPDCTAVVNPGDLFCEACGARQSA